MMTSKPTIFKHLVRINPRCNKEAGNRLYAEFRKMIVVVGIDRHFDHVMYVYSKRYLGNDIRKFASKLRFNIIFSWVEDGRHNPEDNCGLERAGTKNQKINLPKDRLLCFGFAAQLLAEQPFRFEAWEENAIPFSDGNLKKYYFENFLDNDARNKIKTSFSTELGDLANYMTENHFGMSFPWVFITKYFNRICVPTII